ncbi:MAG: hypothetical protein ACREKH_22235 [Candidatus Rokuibacteriota bacterium]
MVATSDSTWLYCVELSSFPTGYTLLADSGATLIYDATPEYGAEICEINGTGCDYPSQACFCDSSFWSYWLSSGTAWNFASAGATCTPVANGDVQGWMWGDGSTPPPFYTFEQICGTEARAKAPKARALERRPQRPHGARPAAQPKR